MIAEWHRATACDDVEAVLGLMTDDVAFFVPNRAPMRGRDAFAAALRGVLRDYRIESTYEIDEVTTTGDLGYACTRLSVTILPRDGGPPMQRDAQALTVLRKGPDARWRVARDANLPHDPP